MKTTIKKISQAVQVLLLTPIKLPGKALNILKYVAVALGVLETVFPDKEDEEIPIAQNREETEGAARHESAE